MDCPQCNEALARARYEGVSIRCCLSCRGYLVDEIRTEAIKSRFDRTPDQLKLEIDQHLKGDNLQPIRCPRCRREMTKTPLRMESAHFHIDTCDECRLIWFDGGELAMLQLAFEGSDQGTEAKALRRRHEEMTPAERAEFEDNLAELPEPPSVLTTVIEGLFFNPRWRQRGVM